MIGDLHVKVSYLSCLQVPTALPLPTALLPTASPPLDVSTVGASIVAALNSDAVLHAAVGTPHSQSATPETFCQSATATPEPATPEPATPETFRQSAPPTPETFCQSATATPVPELPTARYATVPEMDTDGGVYMSIHSPPVEPVESMEHIIPYAVGTRGRKRKAVNYSTSAQESKKMHEARQASGYWMSSRG